MRARRRELQEHDDAVSYVRRVAQGRADLARAELARRGGGGESAVAIPTSCATSSPTGCSAAPDARHGPVEDFSDHPLSDELDRLCADHGFGRLAELDAGELAALTAALDAFEAERLGRATGRSFAELDALTDELVVALSRRAADDQARDA